MQWQCQRGCVKLRLRGESSDRFGFSTDLVPKLFQHFPDRRQLVSEQVWPWDCGKKNSFEGLISTGNEFSGGLAVFYRWKGQICCLGYVGRFCSGTACSWWAPVSAELPGTASNSVFPTFSSSVSVGEVTFPYIFHSWVLKNLLFRYAHLRLWSFEFRSATWTALKPPWFWACPTRSLVLIISFNWVCWKHSQWDTLIFFLRSH